MNKAAVRTALDKITVAVDQARELADSLEGDVPNEIKGYIIDISLAAEEIRKSLTTRTALGTTNRARRR